MNALLPVFKLFNELQRFFATEEVSFSGHLPEEATWDSNDQHAGQDDIPLDKAIEEFEIFYLPLTLTLHDEHKGKAAESFQIDRKTLYRKPK